LIRIAIAEVRMPSPPIPVIVNREGGAASKAGPKLADTISDAFRNKGREAQVLLVPGADIARTIRDHLERPLIAVAGGDGTIGCAATAIIETKSQTSLGILPLGTRNHLARQLDIPLDVPGAVAAICEGEIRAIDVGCVDGHIFINNASIGVYPKIVDWRDRTRDRHGIPKGLATLIGSWMALRRLRPHKLRIAIEGESKSLRTPLLFIGNGVYQLEAGHIGERASLEQSELSIFAVASATRLGIASMTLRTLLGRARPEEDFAAFGVGAEAEVSGHGSHLDVALDGEVLRLGPKLRFQSLPRALRVTAPVIKAEET
jgi:diacylglycerol kinase family enzyme